MNCYVHPDRESVVTCSFCGKGLCSECADLFESPSCPRCAEQYNRKVMAARTRPLLLTTIVAVAGFFTGLSLNGDAITSLMFMWGILGIYWGWAYVKPMLFATLFGTIAWRGTGFVLGLMLVALAMGLGMFVGPFLLAKNIYEYIRDKKAFDSVKHTGA